jgi:DNA-binding MarR family transcriptional regulator
MKNTDKSAQLLASNLQKIMRCFDMGATLKKQPLLTITQMRVLSYFSDCDVIHVSDISRRADMSIQSLNNLISRLEALGYVERSPNVQDRRMSDIRLTDTGRASIEIFQRFHVQQLQGLLKSLSAQELYRLAEALEEAAGILEKAKKKANIKKPGGALRNGH